MRITIESTAQLVDVVTPLGVVPARVWEGHTESGIPVTVLVTRIAVDRLEDLSAFEDELIEQQPPAWANPAYPLRLVL